MPTSKSRKPRKIRTVTVGGRRADVYRGRDAAGRTLVYVKRAAP